ncbi:MAG: hypothetical protein ACOCZH_05920 [Phototrophicaceae bacterium]
MTAVRIVIWLLALLAGMGGSHAQTSACAGLNPDDCARLHAAWRATESARFTLDLELEIRDTRTADLARLYMAADGVYYLPPERAGDDAANLLDWLPDALDGIRADVDVVTPGADRSLPLDLPQDESAWHLRLVDGVGYARGLLPAGSSGEWTGVDLSGVGPLLATIPGLDGLRAWFAGTPPPAELFYALGNTQGQPDIRLGQQKAAVYETTFDMEQILADASYRADAVALLFELARLAAVPRQYSTSGLLRSAGYIADALSTTSIQVTQVVGLDDNRLHHVALSASFAPGTSRPVDRDAVRTDPDPLGLVAVLPFDFYLNAVLTLDGFDSVPAIDAPADAILVPLPALLAPPLRGTPL